MHRLGYKKFYVQGGDWGGLIGSTMTTIFPKVRLNSCIVKRQHSLTIRRISSLKISSARQTQCILLNLIIAIDYVLSSYLSGNCYTPWIFEL